MLYLVQVEPMEILEQRHPLMERQPPVVDLVDKQVAVAMVDPAVEVVVVAPQVLEMFLRCHHHKEITVAPVLVEMRKRTGPVVEEAAQGAPEEIPPVPHRLPAPVITQPLELLPVVQVEAELSTQ